MPECGCSAVVAELKPCLPVYRYHVTHSSFNPSFAGFRHGYSRTKWQTRLRWLMWTTMSMTAMISVCCDVLISAMY